MKVRLNTLRGSLVAGKTRKAKNEVKIRRSPFVIGSASDCSMCCRSDRISPRHCELRIEPEQVTLRDLASENGTFVNGVRVESTHALQNGDRLRIGRLEFEVLIEDPAPVWEVGPRTHNDTIHDAMAETVCDILCAADEKDRVERLQNPELRQFNSRSGAPKANRQSIAESKGRARSSEGKSADRSGKSPARLRAAEDSSIAASKALNSCFGKRKT
jgi:predicted component of type VI protein secretion system